jgi:hypothetical protein
MLLMSDSQKCCAKHRDQKRLINLKEKNISNCMNAMTTFYGTTTPVPAAFQRVRNVHIRCKHGYLKDPQWATTVNFY